MLKALNKLTTLTMYSITIWLVFSYLEIIIKNTTPGAAYSTLNLIKLLTNI
jgi:hypothetical protein